MALFNFYIHKNVAGHLTLLLFGLLVSFASFGQAPAPISSLGGVCAGETRSFVDATSGGTWSTSNSAIATVGSSTGLVTGEALGTATITYTTSGGIATITATVTPIPCGPVVLSNVCAGATVVEMGCTGTWSTGSTTVATIDSVTGAVTGIIPGSASLTVTSVPGCSVTNTITVYPAAPPIVGTRSFCSSVRDTLSEALSGGTWSSSNTLIATVSSTGIVAGAPLAPGTTTISYTASTGCAATALVTVNPAPSPCACAPTLCDGQSATFYDGTTGGTWSSSYPSVASVGATSGIVTGGSVAGGGVVTITYYIPPTGCFASAAVTVYPNPSVILGVSQLCAGATIALVDTTASGYWTSSNSIATVDPFLGIVTGVSGGTDTISYTVAVSSCSATRVVTVNPLPAVYTLSAGGSYCSGATGIDITLSGSNTSTSYQLFIPGGPTPPAPIPGVGSALDFGYRTAGTYKAIAENTVTGCTDTMAGSAAVTSAPLPNVYSVLGGGSYCPGGTGMDVYLGGSDVGVIYQLYNGATEIDSLSGTGASLNFGLQTATGTYIVIARNVATGCSDAMMGSTTISLSPIPVISGSTSVCSGATISETAPGFTSGTWSSSNTAVAAINSYTGIVSGVSAGTATITFTSVAGCTGTTIVTVSLSPSTISGTRSVCVGSTTTLNATPYGGVWTSSSVAVATISLTGIMTGAAAGTTTIYYSIGTGCIVAALITVNPSPATYNVSGGGTYCAGGTGAPIGLSGSDIGVNYQLYMGGTLVGMPVTGSGSAISFGYQTAAGAYTVVAENTATTCTESMTGAATVTVSPLPFIYTLSVGGSYCSGAAGADITLSGSSVGNTYKLVNVSIVVGTVTGTGTPLDFGSYPAGIYTAIASSSGCVATMANSDIITALPSPTAYTVTGGGSYCTGGPGAHVGLSGSDAGMSYQLFDGTIAVGGPISGIGLSLDFGVSSDTGVYTVIATNTATGCTATMSGSARISIIALPSVYTVTGGGSYCTGGSGVVIGLSSSSSGVSYQVYDGSVLVGSSFTGTGSALDFGDETAAGAYKVIATNPAGTGCTDTMAGSTLITINSLPAVHSVTGGGTRCASGAGIAVGLDGSSAGVDYTLYDGGSMITSMPGTGSPLNFGLGTVAGTYTVAAANITTGCTDSMAGSAVITVIPSVTPSITITATPGDTVCAGTTVTFSATLINGGSSPTFSWIVNGVNMSTDSIYTYIPGNGDYIYETLVSSATCATPSSVVSNHITMAVHALPAIAGGSSVCAGSAIPLTDTSGGIWTSSNPAVATIATIGATTGVVSGVGPGTVTLTYTLDTACIVTTTFTVHSLPVITASSSVVPCGGGYTLTGSGGLSYTWWPSTGVSCTTCATTDVIPESTTTYYVTGTNAEGCFDSAAVTVDGNRISGYISPAIGGSIKVWLIQFNASDSSIAALDSTTSCISGGQPYYEFDDKPAGNYLIKAFLIGGTPGASGYIPTYGLSSPHWDSATSIAHTGAADTLHIDLIYGTVPTGPGFIGGLISSGAGRGTTMDVPAAGMLVYLMDAASNRVLTYNYTDTNGAYSFSNIAYGNYIIYPEDYDYNTTPWPTLSLSSATDSVTNANFKQHTTARTITPITAPAGTNAVVSSKSVIQVYPNPTSGSLNIQWNNQQAGNSAVLITDMLGREVYKSTININAISGETPINISSLKNGIYLISIKTESMDFNGKLIIEK